MNKLKTIKGSIIGIVVAIGLILIAIFQMGLGGTPKPIVNNDTESTGPRLVSTIPPELFEKKPMVFPPDQIIKLNFSDELVNGPETKLVFDPPAEIKVDVENNNKTVKITPVQPWKLGQGYTIFIQSDTKLKSGKTLGKEFNLHFNVINYSGI